ncbi:MAG: MFS transporter, partial [Alphaproteobacteria bacterium]|nr:MFS transporter [Alphaproteobacteria bacterium]
DALIGHCLERPLPHKAVIAQDVLRLGVAQLVFVDTPAHAAVDTTVELARALGADAHIKLVNAVMRRLDREGRALAAAQDAPLLNTPGWLWRSWVAAYGEDAARAIAAAHLREAPLDITVRGEPQAWAE